MFVVCDWLDTKSVGTSATTTAAVMRPSKNQKLFKWTKQQYCRCDFWYISDLCSLFTPKRWNLWRTYKHTTTTFSSLSNLVCDPQEFKSMKNRLHLAFQGSWSKRDKICFLLRHQNALTERPGKTPYRDKAIGDYTGHSHIILQAANSERLIYLQTY